MTTIDISKDIIHVFGHSEYAPEGFDIVCSAISTLTESLDRYLRVTENQVETQADNGRYIIYLDKLNSTGEALISEYKNMVDELAKEYPRNIRRLSDGKIRKIRKIRKNT